MYCWSVGSSVFYGMNTLIYVLEDLEKRCCCELINSREGSMSDTRHKHYSHTAAVRPRPLRESIRPCVRFAWPAAAAAVATRSGKRIRGCYLLFTLLLLGVFVSCPAGDGALLV